MSEDGILLTHFQSTLFPVCVSQVVSTNFCFSLGWWQEALHEKKTPWPLVRERTIPTEQPPLVDEI
jgi:hypothetical protein